MERPDPDQLLKRVQAQESPRGHLKLFFGANAGVGKTYAMLEAARQRRKEGVDVLVGLVETHGRGETAALLEGLEALPRRRIPYKGVTLEEFDLDAALARRPALLLVDELAHTNAEGCRHAKRWQDVQELMDAGISVYTTLNVQHWESLNDVVAQVTGVVVRETVPDTFLEQTDDIELVDISAEDLLKRLKEGKVYIGPQAQKAAEHFFKPGNLVALRELALRHTAERVDLQVQALKADTAAKKVWPVSDRLLVGVTASPLSARLVRAAHRIASRLRCEWIVLHIETPQSATLPAEDRARLLQTLRLADELGAETVTLTGDGAPATLVEYARSRNVSRIVVGKPRRPLWRERLFGSVVNDIAHLCGDIDLYVISGVGEASSPRAAVQEKRAAPPRYWAFAVGTVAAVTLGCWPLAPLLDRPSLVMAYLLTVMGVAYRCGRDPAVAAAVLSVLCFDYFYVPPTFSLAVAEPRVIVTFIVMLCVGLLIGTVTGRLRLQNKTSLEREARTWALYRLSRELSETPEPLDLAVKAWRHLEEFYRTPVVLLRAGEEGSLKPAAGDAEAFPLDAKETAVAKWVFDHGQEAGAGTNTLAAARGLYLPLRGLQGTVGVLAVRPGERISAQDPEQLHLLQTFASEIGAALASTELSASAGRAEAQVEAERLRNLILSSFSIDVNEPLGEISRITRRLLGGAAGHAEELKAGLQEIQDKAIRLGSIARELPRLIEDRTRQRLAAPEPAPRRSEPQAPAGRARLSEFLAAGNVIIAKERRTREQVFQDLIATLDVPDAAEALSLILEREKAGSTIIGSGLAIPHARIPGLTRVKAALGVVQGGMSAPTAEGETAQVVILFLSPLEEFRGHLAFLAAVTGLFRKEGLTQELLRAAGPAEALETIRRAEAG